MQDENKIGFFSCIFLTMARVYKQLVCSHPRDKRYVSNHKVMKCYNCDKVLK